MIFLLEKRKIFDNGKDEKSSYSSLNKYSNSNKNHNVSKNKSISTTVSHRKSRQGNLIQKKFFSDDRNKKAMITHNSYSEINKLINPFLSSRDNSSPKDKG